MTRRDHYLRGLTRNPLFDRDYLRLRDGYRLTKPARRRFFPQVWATCYPVLLGSD